MFFLFPFLFLQPAGAQEEGWTLEQCLGQALQNNISIQQRKLSNELLDVGMEQTRASRFPTLSANAGHGYSFGRSIDPYTNEYIEQNIGSNSVSFNSSLNLFNGFQTTNSIRQQEIDREAGKLDLEQLKKDISISVAEAYLQVLYAHEQVDNAVKKLESGNAQMERTERLVKAGMVPESNLLLIISQVASDNSSLINAGNQLRMANLNLMQVMEVPFDEGFYVKRPSFDKVIDIEPLVFSSEEAFALALRSQPVVESYALRVASAEKDLEIARGAMYPRLSLNAGLSSGYSNARSLYERETTFEDTEIGYLLSNPAEKVFATRALTTITPVKYTIGKQYIDNISESVRLSLSIPLFNQKQVRSNISRSVISVESARLNEQNTLNQLRKTIEQSYQDLTGARMEYLSALEQLASNERSFFDIQRKYELGLSNATDYLIEQNNYFNAQSAVSRARFKLVFRRLILDYLMGNQMILSDEQ